MGHAHLQAGIRHGEIKHAAGDTTCSWGYDMQLGIRHAAGASGATRPASHHSLHPPNGSLSPCIAASPMLVLPLSDQQRAQPRSEPTLSMHGMEGPPRGR